MVDVAPQAQTGTTAVTSTGDAAAPVAPKPTRQEQALADRAAFLAGIDSELGAAADDKPAEKKPVAKAKPAEDDSGDDAAGDLKALADDVEDEDDDLELEDDEDDDEVKLETVDDDDDDTEDKDPDVAKRLAKVRKQEKRIREQADLRDRAFEQQKATFLAEYKPKLEALEKFEKLKGRKSDPAGLLKSLGFDDDELGGVAQILWGMSKEGAADPKYREQAKRLMRDRELAEKADAADQRSAALEKKLADRDAQSETDRKVDAYRARIAKSVTDETPLAKKRLAATPKAAQKELDKIALQLGQKAGGFVDPKKVVQTYEKRLKTTVDRIKALAGDDAPVAKPAAKTAAVAAKPKAAIAVVDKTDDKPATTNGRVHFPTREEMLADIAKLKDSDSLD